MKLSISKEPIFNTVDIDLQVKTGKTKIADAIYSAASILSNYVGSVNSFKHLWDLSNGPMIVNIVLPEETAIELKYFTVQFLYERLHRSGLHSECQVVFGELGLDGHLDLHVYAYGLTRDNRSPLEESKEYFPVLLLDPSTLELFKTKAVSECSQEVCAFIDQLENSTGIIAILSHPQDKLDLTEH